MSHARVVSLIVVTLAICESGVLAQDADRQQLPASTAAAVEKSQQAIAECRERRLRKELADYKASAECASPKIFAAWREAGYPDMDLITAWLSAREAASAQVDQKAITPKEFERQMDELTMRLTAEERRRRAGLVNTPDNGLELQLPPSAQVVGVATPAGQDKLAKKKSAAARAVAATQFVDPSSGTQMQSMASLSPLDSQKATATARSGAGGPFVPVPIQGAGGLYVHLASQRSEADARAAFRMLQQQYPSVLGGHDAVIRRAAGSEGTYYRVEIGPLTTGQADELCGGLRAAGGQCVARSE